MTNEFEFVLDHDIIDRVKIFYKNIELNLRIAIDQNAMGNFSKLISYEQYIKSLIKLILFYTPYIDKIPSTENNVEKLIPKYSKELEYKLKQIIKDIK